MIRYHARWVLPVSAPPIRDATVAVDGARIAYVGPRAGAPPGEDRDLGEALLMPGLVNAHTHLELTVFRGMLDGLSFREWIVQLQRAKTRELYESGEVDRVVTPESLSRPCAQWVCAGSCTRKSSAPRPIPLR